MANLVAFGTGTTSATATLVAPPGEADGAIGLKYIVLDSIHVGVGNTAAVTAGTFELQRGGAGVGQLLSNLTQIAGDSAVYSFTFNGGFRFPGADGAATRTVVCTATAAAQTRVIVEYHYE